MEGREKGYIRHDIDAGFVVELLFRNIQVVTNTAFIESVDYKISEMAQMVIDIFTRGIMDRPAK